MSIQVGARGSVLSRTQTGHVIEALRVLGIDAEIHIVTTAGDVNMAPVERIGVGVFTQALREALADGECDLAVHSYKDLPSAPDDRFHLVVPPRVDAREALITRDGLSLAELPVGAKVGTSAPRRIAQLHRMRTDLEILPLRGNIDTRMGKVANGELDAIVLAYAGLTRLGRGAEASALFALDELMPAPAQGALAVECRAADSELVAALDRIADVEATACVRAERTLLATLEAGCTAPVAAHATFNQGQVSLRAGVFALDGSRRLVREDSAPAAQAAELGARLATALLADGAAAVMAG